MKVYEVSNMTVETTVVDGVVTFHPMRCTVGEKPIYFSVYFREDGHGPATWVRNFLKWDEVTEFVHKKYFLEGDAHEATETEAEA